MTAERLSLPQLVGLESRPSFRRFAVAATALFLVATVDAAFFGSGHGPAIPAFLPVAAALWSAAELLTAVLLFSQFFVSGKVSLGIIAAAYLVTGS